MAKTGKDKNEVWMGKLRAHFAKRTDIKPLNKRIIDRLIANPSLPRKQAKFFVSIFLNLEYQILISVLIDLIQFILV